MTSTAISGHPATGSSSGYAPTFRCVGTCGGRPRCGARVRAVNDQSRAALPAPPAVTTDLPAAVDLLEALSALPSLGVWVEDAACGDLGVDGSAVLVADSPDVEQYAEAGHEVGDGSTGMAGVGTNVGTGLPPTEGDDSVSGGMSAASSPPHPTSTADNVKAASTADALRGICTDLAPVTRAHRSRACARGRTDRTRRCPPALR